MRHLTGRMMLATILAAESAFSAINPPQGKVIVPPQPKTTERLTKAEKKRQRKAEQRARLADKVKP